VRSSATLPRLADRLVNLPTHERVEVRDINEVVDRIAQVGQDAARMEPR
jgi:hypothetical protein